MWPFNRTYDTATRVSADQLRQSFAVYAPEQTWPLDNEYLLWSATDAQHFVWRYGIPDRSYRAELDDCDDAALDTLAAWRAGARKDGLPRHPAYGVLWIKRHGSAQTHMTNYWCVRGNIFLYDGRFGEFSSMTNVEKILGRLG